MRKALVFLAVFVPVLLTTAVGIRVVAEMGTSGARADLSTTPTPQSSPHPSPDDSAWITYQTVGISLPAPAGLEKVEVTTTIRLADRPDANAHLTILTSPDGRPFVSIATVANPQDLDLSSWIAAVPGWPGEGVPMNVNGREGILFETDQEGSSNPTFYVGLGESVIAIRGAVDLDATSGPMSRGDFDQVLGGVSYDE